MTTTDTQGVQATELLDDARRTVRVAVMHLLAEIDCNLDAWLAETVGDLLKLSAIATQIGQEGLSGYVPPLRSSDIEGLGIATRVVRDLSPDYTNAREVGEAYAAFYVDAQTRAERVQAWLDQLGAGLPELLA